ncbi:MAG: hypothetical protein R8J94_21735 [Acidimicrobiia bacterium]|nr:hypothetical protein [Acidimicrobiia bacterium]
MTPNNLGVLLSNMSTNGGSFYRLREADTCWSVKEDRPWVFPNGYDPGRSINYALPRSTTDRRTGPNSSPSIPHAKHEHDDEEMCDINCDGWVVGEPHPVKREWIQNASFICDEPDWRVLTDIKLLFNECL